MQCCHNACGHVKCLRAECLYCRRCSAMLPTTTTPANCDHHMHAGHQPVAGSRTQGCPQWPAPRGPAAAASCGSTRLVPWSARPSSPGPPHPSAAPPAKHSRACVVRCSVLENLCGAVSECTGWPNRPRNSKADAHHLTLHHPLVRLHDKRQARARWCSMCSRCSVALRRKEPGQCDAVVWHSNLCGKGCRSAVPATTCWASHWSHRAFKRTVCLAEPMHRGCQSVHAP